MPHVTINKSQPRRFHLKQQMTVSKYRSPESFAHASIQTHDVARRQFRLGWRIRVFPVSSWRVSDERKRVAASAATGDDDRSKGIFNRHRSTKRYRPEWIRPLQPKSDFRQFRRGNKE